MEEKIYEIPVLYEMDQTPPVGDCEAGFNAWHDCSQGNSE